ncbi:hypothetical protein GQX74_005583 [Glossina fuscipes]|nr:hypothetical protein GQX74_005583 [Glossina fuscipes]
MNYSLTIKLLLIICVLNARALNHTWGSLGIYDILVARDDVQHPGILMSVTSQYIVFPPKYRGNNVIISAVRVWDWGFSNSFAYIDLVEGGPGYRHCKLHIESQRDEGFHVSIEYFGR